MKICVLKNFSKFKISKSNVHFRLQTKNQSVVKAADYITPVCNSEVLSNRNNGLKRIPKFLKNREKKQNKKNTQLLIISQSQVLN